MALSTPLVLPLLLLVLLLPPALRDYLSARHLSKYAGVGSELHPVILLPGMGCSDLEVTLGVRYFGTVRFGSSVPMQIRFLRKLVPIGS
jgi:lysophospholipase-3